MLCLSGGGDDRNKTVTLVIVVTGGKLIWKYWLDVAKKNSYRWTIFSFWSAKMVPKYNSC